jgi:hypothetical protein
MKYGKLGNTMMERMEKGAGSPCVGLRRSLR